jgi:GAF domain-containing protein
MSMPSKTLDPHTAFAALARINLAETDLDGVLTHVAELAQRTVPGADDVSVTMVHLSTAETAASTGDRALVLDEWQYREGLGPCLKAAAEKLTVSVPDLASDDRWPDWGAHAVSSGARSSLSVGLPIEDEIDGALNIYSTRRYAFGEDAILLAQTFAGYATVALSNAKRYGSTSDLVRDLQASMTSRAVIEQAKGIIMGRQRCSAEQAFTILTRIAQDRNRDVRDIATAVVARAEGRGGS